MFTFPYANTVSKYGAHCFSLTVIDSVLRVRRNMDMAVRMKDIARDRFAWQPPGNPISTGAATVPR
jgi:hypothetical protein